MSRKPGNKGKMRNTRTSFNHPPKQTERSKKEGEKFNRADSRHAGEIHISYRNRRNKRNLIYSLGKTETVLEYLTRKRW